MQVYIYTQWKKKLIEYHLNQCSQNSSVGVNL